MEKRQDKAFIAAIWRLGPIKVPVPMKAPDFHSKQEEITNLDKYEPARDRVFPAEAAGTLMETARGAARRLGGQYGSDSVQSISKIDFDLAAFQYEFLPSAEGHNPSAFGVDEPDYLTDPLYSHMLINIHHRDD